MTDWLYTYLVHRPFKFFYLPNQKLYIPYLLIGMGIAIVWLMLRGKPFKKTFSIIFRKNLWIHPSSLVDYKIFVFNAYTGPLLYVAIGGFGGGYLATVILDYLNLHYPHSGIEINHTLAISLYTVLLVVWIDFVGYIIHYMYHFVPFFWEFHKIHHSAEVLNPVTNLRSHPVQKFMNGNQKTIALGVFSGVFCI